MLYTKISGSVCIPAIYFGTIAGSRFNGGCFFIYVFIDNAGAFGENLSL